MVKAVIFDLDDTLAPELDYVKSGCIAIAEYIAGDNEAARSEYANAFTEIIAISPFGVIDRFCERYAEKSFDKDKLIEVCRSHKPTMSLYPDVLPCLNELKAKGVKLALLTDGRPEGQRNKIAALGIENYFDKIVITDELGGPEYRKPNPAGYELICSELGVSFSECLAVGDNPSKDLDISDRGMNAVIILRNGIYSGSLQDKPCQTISTLEQLTDMTTEVMADNIEEENKAFIRERLMHIMDFVHDVCVKEDIKYSLSCGSMLGAVRHKGFIPWDDDIDIMTTRSEYDRFKAVINDYCKDTEFCFVDYKTRIPIVCYRQDPEKNGIRFIGIRVDIFLFDNYPDSVKLRKKQIFKMKILQGMLHKGKTPWDKYNLKGKILVAGTKFLGMFRTRRSLISSYVKLSTKYNGIETSDMFLSNDGYAKFPIAYKKEWLDKVSLMPFEDRSYYVYDDFDPILELEYGDYMVEPPLDKRVGGHIEYITVNRKQS